MLNIPKNREGVWIQDRQDDKYHKNESKGDKKEGNSPFEPFIAFEQFASRENLVNFIREFYECILVFGNIIIGPEFHAIYRNFNTVLPG